MNTKLSLRGIVLTSRSRWPSNMSLAHLHSVPLAIKVLCHQPLYRVIFAVFLAVLAFETHAESTVLRVAQA